MKNHFGNHIKLGVFVSLGIALFILGIYFVGARQHLFSNTFRLSAIFSDISGLQVGSNVRFTGINVGVVNDIVQITDTTVRVDMQIEEQTRKFLKKNAKALIGSDGLVGDKIISISAGKIGMPCVANNDFLATERLISIDEIMVDMKRATENTVRITDELAFIMENVSDGNGMVGKLFFDSSFAEVMQDAIVNLKEGAGGFKQNMDAASHSTLLKGYLRKKEKAKEKAAEEAKENKTKKTKRNVIGRN